MVEVGGRVCVKSEAKLQDDENYILAVGYARELKKQAGIADVIDYR